MNRKPHSYSSVELGNVSGLVSPPALTPGCLRGIHKNRLMPLGEHYNKITIIIPPQTICTAYKALVHCFICGNFYNPLTLGATETREVKKTTTCQLTEKSKPESGFFSYEPSALPVCQTAPSFLSAKSIILNVGRISPHVHLLLLLRITHPYVSYIVFLYQVSPKFIL